NPVGATLARAQGTGTIIDDDSPVSLSIADYSANEGNSGTSAFTFVVNLSGPSGNTVTVNYSTSDGTATTGGSDYQATSGALPFSTGQMSKTITVLVNGDTVSEANETFYVTLSGASGASISRAQATGTIINDDGVPAPTVSVTSVSANEGNSGTTAFVFNV